MTQPEDRNRRRTDLPLIVFGPVLALGTLTALLALLAGLFGWHANQMLVTAAAVGAAVVVAALALVYRQVTERRATEGALHDIEARVGSIVEAAMDALITVDESQHIVLFNAAAEALFGCPREQAIGAPLAWFIPERFRAEHERHIRRFGDTRTLSRRMGGQRIVMGLRRNGEEFPIDASISQTTENGKKLYTVILRDVTERIRAEEALRRSQTELRELAYTMNSVREEEKRRIARELHDELGQALTALKLDLTWLSERLPAGQAAIAEKLGAMQAMIDGTVAATRRISSDLRPLILDDLGLVPAAEWLVQEFTQRTGIPCELVVGSPDLELKDPHATAVFRILQESLTNVARHAKAQRVEVALGRADGTVTLNVRDNGRGFNLDDPRRPNAFGLMGLRERVSLLGGEVRIESQPGLGTVLDVQIPLEEGTQAE
jgi:PAS domain S-box-containing protein